MDPWACLPSRVVARVIALSSVACSTPLMIARTDGNTHTYTTHTHTYTATVIEGTKDTGIEFIVIKTTLSSTSI